MAVEAERRGFREREIQKKTAQHEAGGVVRGAAAPLPRLPGPAPWVVAGYLLIAGLVGGLGAWAAIAEISGAVIGPGTVTVESNIKTVQHLDGGIVAEIRVRDGDRVNEGDVLLRLDDTETRASLSQVMAHLSELYAQRARLEAELQEEDRIVFPEALLAEAPRNERTKSFLRSQELLFKARRQRQTGEEGLLRQQIEQLTDQVRGLAAQHDAEVRQAKLITEEMEAVRPLLEQGLYKMSQMKALEREKARLEGEVGKLMGDIARIKNTMLETELKISQLKKEAAQTVLTEMRETISKIADYEEQRVAAEEKLKRIEVRAPRSGIVHKLAVHTVGGVISPASPLLDIVPESDPLIIEARIPPNQVDQVRAGLRASVRIEAVDARLAPNISGRVKKVSGAQIEDKQKNTSYFTAIVEILPGELEKIGPGKKLIPGMPAEVFIETDERTVLDYLLRPLRDRIGEAFREPH